MGHRLSKTTVNSCNATDLEQQQQKSEQEQQHNKNQTHHAAPSLLHTSSTSTAESNIPTINLQIQETPNDNNNVQIHSVREAENSSSTCSRQIIIKIQLAKMENDVQQLVNTSECCNEHYSSSNSGSSTLSRNANNNGAQFLNLTFNRNTTQGEFQAAQATTTADTSRLQQQQQRSSKQLTGKVIDERTAGSSPSFVVNNNFSPNVVVTSTTAPGRQDNFNILMGPMSDLQLDEKRMSVASVVSSASSSGEFVQNTAGDCQAEQQSTALALASNSCADENADDYCCRRKSKSNTFPSKWRCYKCTCRDAFKRIMDASSSKSSKKKEQRNEKTNSPKNQQHSSEQQPLWTPLQTNSPRSNGVPLTSNGQQSATAAPHMSIWSPSTNDVIIPISSPQFVVVQCPPSSVVTLGRIDDNAIRLMATELVAANSNNAQRLLNTTAELSATPANSSTTTTSSSIATPNRGGGGGGGGMCPAVSVATGIAAGPVVHSQVDYIHCLVPDLERITKSSFYWGKMDRYEAERLLEGKPEGTFLLRDSAQEEYLFSVTFRKYGRSLHARIEQSNHKFSFDCHDPCVFTASTVTGLLEHYKDPACVMFFEPMLTIPLHRNTTFSLQQLCRATIVSNTSYDGINELELPSRLKSYLKEYHYKQKLRVKPFDEPFYSCT